ncbi:HpcH/HpaI aldolase/citrate lyase family protein [Bordetella bronchiseptica MBORD635]|uniref:HpcH/HpaI aldolase family protein n=1 Tax=Bordetella bronchiseptica TaxID=518 RepID=UPI0004619C23|nr:aldolase/citrate lyase family protein [Bordetella bronchiseptica]KDC79309.1 HpcH/HpaI aldolase/citrate lyase family protein [Bordetella bronchiseptica MBORD635]
MSAATFKAKLAARRTASLVNPDHPSSSLVSFMCTLGVDAFMLDCEQGSPSFENIEDMTRAARLGGAASLVRIPSPEPWTIERYMMRGVDGLVVPRLDDAATAARVVDDIRYCAPRDFDRKTVIVQIESAQAVAGLDDFLAVDHIDCYFIGVVDLSKSMGFRGDYGGPEVMAALDETVARILRAGKCAGIMVKEHDLAAWSGKGVSMLYTHLNDFAAMGARSWRALAKVDGV